LFGRRASCVLLKQKAAADVDKEAAAAFLHHILKLIAGELLRGGYAATTAKAVIRFISANCREKPR